MMPGTSCLRGGVNNFRPIRSSKGGWVGTITPRRQTDDYVGEARFRKEKADAEPIVVFSRPPQPPPFIGPLIALSLLGSWTKRDKNDD